MKRQRRKRPRGFGAVYQRGEDNWWIRPPGGKREPGGKTRKEAEDLLEKRMAEARVGRLIPECGRASFDDLEQMLLDDMRANGRRSIRNVELSILPPLRSFFSGMRARDISYDVVSGYVARRFAAKPKPAAATVRYERAVLRRMFNIAYRAGKVDRVPAFPSIRVENTRTGFCSPEEIERVIQHLPEHAKGPVRCLYLTGWRTGEVLGLTWVRVDFEAKAITLDAEHTKNGKPRVFPFSGLPALAELLRERRERTSALERERSQVIPWVFHLEGERIASFRDEWGTAVKETGLPWLLPHDMRRSAARNLVRAGVSERVVMELCGWRTRAMFDRYNVTADDDLRDGVGRLGEFLGRRNGKAQKSADGSV